MEKPLINLGKFHACNHESLILCRCISAQHTDSYKTSVLIKVMFAEIRMLQGFISQISLASPN